MISQSQVHPWRPAWRAILSATLLLPLFALIHFPAYCLRFAVEISGAPSRQFRSTVVAALANQVTLLDKIRIRSDGGGCLTFHDLPTLPNPVTVGSSLLSLVDLAPRTGPAIARSTLLLDCGLVLVVGRGSQSGAQFRKESARPAYYSWDAAPCLPLPGTTPGDALLRVICPPQAPLPRVVGNVANEPAVRRPEIGAVPLMHESEHPTRDNLHCIVPEYHPAKFFPRPAGGLCHPPHATPRIQAAAPGKIRP